MQSRETDPAPAARFPSFDAWTARARAAHRRAGRLQYGGRPDVHEALVASVARLGDILQGAGPHLQAIFPSAAAQVGPRLTKAIVATLDWVDQTLDICECAVAGHPVRSESLLEFGPLEDELLAVADLCNESDADVRDTDIHVLVYLVDGCVRGMAWSAFRFARRAHWGEATGT